MDYFYKIIKNRIAVIHNSTVVLLVLGLFCLIFLYGIRLPDTWNWDDFSYLLNIMLQRPSGLLLGRSGFTFPIEAIWYYTKPLGFSFSFVEEFIRHANIWILTLTYLLLFKILQYLKFSPFVSAICILLLLSELSFSTISSRVMDSPLMYLALVSSLYLFITSHNKQNKGMLYLSGFLCGYSLLIREPAVLYWPIFLVFFYLFKKENLLYTKKTYLLFFCIIALTSASGPLILYLMDGDEFINNFNHSFQNAKYFIPTTLSDILNTFLNSHLNYYTLPIGILGLYLYAGKTEHKNKIFAIAILCLFPVILSFFILSVDAVKESRFFFTYFLLNALGQSFLVDHLRKYYKNHFITFFIVLTLFIANFYRCIPEYLSEKNIVARQNNYYEKIRPLLSPDTVFILGYETQMVRYRGLLEGIRVRTISPGWSWPKGLLVEDIKSLILNNRKVIYDSNAADYNPERKADLEQMAQQFRLIEIYDGFYRIESKP